MHNKTCPTALFVVSDLRVIQ